MTSLYTYITIILQKMFSLMNKCSTTRTYITSIIQLFPFFFKKSKKQIHSMFKYGFGFYEKK